MDSFLVTSQQVKEWHDMLFHCKTYELRKQTDKNKSIVFRYLSLNNEKDKNTISKV